MIFSPQWFEVVRPTIYSPIDGNDEGLLKSFLSESCDKKHTAKSYRIGLLAFSNWLGQSLTDIKANRSKDWTPAIGENEIDFRVRRKTYENKVLEFHTYLTQSKGVNTARNYSNSVRMFFQYLESPLDLMRKSKKKLNKKENGISFPLDINHLRRMYQIADLREKTILSLGIDLSWRAGDFTNLKITDLPNLDQECPIPLGELKTEKESTLPHSYLSQETVELLKAYLRTLDNTKPNPYLFRGYEGKPLSEEQLYSILRDLANKADIATNGNKLSWHCLRKLFLSTSENLGILVSGMYMVGKTVQSERGTYLNALELRKSFAKIKSELMLNVSMTQDEIKTQQLSINDRTELRANYKIALNRIESQDKRIIQLEKENRELNEYIMNSQDSIMKFTNNLVNRLPKIETQEGIKQ